MIARQQLGFPGRADISGNYDDLAQSVVEKVNAGQPALFYAWTPNWTNTVLVDGENAVWGFLGGE